MIRTICALALVALLTPLSLGQQSAAPQSALTTQAAAQADGKFDPLLRRYETDYERHNLDDLQVIWPVLKDDPKTTKRIKEEFDRADISDMKVSLQVQDVQSRDADVVALHLQPQ